jgi:hypothetical protein
MNGWTNIETWHLMTIVHNDEALDAVLRTSLAELGEDIALFHNADDDGEFQDFFVPVLARRFEEVVRGWDGWLRPDEIQAEFDCVNFAELAVAFVQENFARDASSI